MEWRYGTPATIFNVDETTTSSKLGGGFSPMSFATKKKVIHYGLISRSLFRKGLTINGELIGSGSNVMLDEINRTDFENISFLMGFFESPHKYFLEEEGRPFLNPNHRHAFDFEYRWIFCGTMNIQDIGNQPLSLAFKSRFHIIQIRYTKEQMKTVLNKLLNLTLYEEDIFDKLYKGVDSWKIANEIKFPAGIRHYHGFFKFLRNGLKKLTHYGSITPDSLVIRDAEFTLGNYLNEILRSSIMMPIIDENRAGLVESKEEQIKKLAGDFTDVIANFLIEQSNILGDEKLAYEQLETYIY